MPGAIKLLQSIVTRKGSSRALTFGTPHVFLALRAMSGQKYSSRQLLVSELHVGEGAVRTLILHMKQHGLADSVRSGTFLTQKGIRLAKKLSDAVPAQCKIKPCNVARERHNHAILLKDCASTIGNGMDQRDYAILYGARGATTLAFESGRFVFPGESVDCLSDDPQTREDLLEKLRPEENDLVIIASSDESFVAEVSAVNSALRTIASHEGR